MIHLRHISLHVENLSNRKVSEDETWQEHTQMNSSRWNLHKKRSISTMEHAIHTWKKNKNKKAAFSKCDGNFSPRNTAVNCLEMPAEMICSPKRVHDSYFIRYHVVIKSIRKWCNAKKFAEPWADIMKLLVKWFDHYLPQQTIIMSRHLWYSWWLAQLS